LGAKFDNNIQYLLSNIYRNMLYFFPYAARNGNRTSFGKHRTERNGGFFPFKHDLSWRQSAELLDDDQVIAVAQSQGIVPALGRKSLYLHDVRISLSGCKINKKYPEFAIRYTM